MSDLTIYTHPFLNDGPNTNLDQTYIRLPNSSSFTRLLGSQVLFRNQLITPKSFYQVTGSDHYPVMIQMELGFS